MSNETTSELFAPIVSYLRKSRDALQAVLDDSELLEVMAHGCLGTVPAALSELPLTN